MDIQKITPDSTTISQKQPPMEQPRALPVPLEPQVVNVLPHGNKTSEKDSDCLIVEDPAVVHYKPKKGLIGTVYPNIPLSSASIHGHPRSSLGATLGVCMSMTAYGNLSTTSSVWPIGASRLNLRPHPLSI